MILTHFQFNSKSVRTVFINNDIWFLGKDIATVLGYSNPSKAIKQHIDKEDTLDDIELTKRTKELSHSQYGTVKRSIYINESGVYSLIFSSRLPSAKKFKRWIISEVIPSIRKTGKYEIDTQPKTRLELAKEQVKLIEEIELQNQLIKDLKGENEHLAEIVDELFDYSSIIRVAKFNLVSEKLFYWRRLKTFSIQLGYEIKKAPSPRFEYQNLYAHDVWKVAYPDYLLPENSMLAKTT